MTRDEAYIAYIEAQGLYASELQRFRDSARPNMESLLKAGELMRAARKVWMSIDDSHD